MHRSIWDLATGDGKGLDGSLTVWGPHLDVVPTPAVTARLAAGVPEAVRHRVRQQNVKECPGPRQENVNTARRTPRGS